MIIVPETNSEDLKPQYHASSSSRSDPPGQFPVPESEMSDPPPSYSSIAPVDGGVSGLQQLPPVRASNFTDISVANGAIKGTYAIDPAISIPAAVLPALRSGESEEDRKNLLLQTNNGSINVELHIASTGYDARSTLKRKRTLISASTRNGSVKMRLHELRDLSSHESQRLPIAISCNSLNGSIEVRLPRSFCGPLRLRTWNGTVQFSDAMKPSVTVFSQVDKLHRCFLGRMDSQEMDLGPNWMGDELNAESMNGSIKLFYDDEVPVVQPKSQSFIGRLLFF